jgi:hypothetical protein
MSIVLVLVWQLDESPFALLGSISFDLLPQRTLRLILLFVSAFQLVCVFCYSDAVGK